MASGEGLREKAMRKALVGDGRFGQLRVSSGLPVDLQFSTEDDEEEKN